MYLFNYETDLFGLKVVLYYTTMICNIWLFSMYFLGATAEYISHAGLDTSLTLTSLIRLMPSRICSKSILIWCLSSYLMVYRWALIGRQKGAPGNNSTVKSTRVQCHSQVHCNVIIALFLYSVWFRLSIVIHGARANAFVSDAVLPRTIARYKNC